MSLIVDNLTIDHGAIRAINNVSFIVPKSKLTAIIGANGAGKTTLLRTLSGLKEPNSGSATWNGESVLNRKPEDLARSGIMHVSDGKSVISELTVKDNLALSGLWRKDKKDVAKATEEVIEIFPILGQRLGQISGSLSGGERQRLTLARALLRRPTLLLLDEATSSLDHENERLIQQAIERLHGELTIVIIAHRLSTVQNADQVIVLDQGRVVECGAPAELAQREGGAFRKLMSAGTNLP